MSDGPRGYVSPSLSPSLKRQGIKVWAVTLAISFIWVFATVLAPLAKLGDVTALSSSLYTFFSYICHQIPDRSFHIGAEPVGVCSRCFGVYFGIFIGIAAYPIWRPIEEIDPLPRFWLFLSLVPAGIDWALTVFGIWENTHLTRVVTGLILGFACATFIVPAMVEIVRNMRSKRELSAG